MAQGHLAFIHNQMFLLGVGILAVISATVTGIEIYSSQAIQENRDTIALDLNTLSDYANVYYKKEKVMGGGGGSFIGFSFPKSLSKNGNGTYKIVYIKDQKLLLEGVGVQKTNSFMGCSEGGAFITSQLLIRPNEKVIYQIK